MPTPQKGGLWDRLQRGNVFVIDSSGSHLQLIHGSGRNPVGYETSGLAYGPAVSPDGSRIAYAAYTESESEGFQWIPWNPWNRGTDRWDIVTAKPDGSDKRIIPVGRWYGVDPVWSPDGSSIVFKWKVVDLGIVGADGSGLQTLMNTTLEWSEIWGPAFSPDGSHIAFAGTKQYEQEGVMYVAGMDGSGWTRLVSEQQLFVSERQLFADPGIPYSGARATHITWSPDGQRIAFAIEMWQPYGYRPRTYNNLYVVGRDGDGLRAIPGASEFVSRKVNSLEWSPDGAEILLSSSGAGATGGIFLINTEDFEIRKILDMSEGYAAQSPDGSRIAVYDGDFTDKLIYTVAWDGSDARILVEQAGDGSLVAAQGRPLE